jgi:hypothetical protein
MAGVRMNPSLTTTPMPVALKIVVSKFSWLNAPPLHVNDGVGTCGPLRPAMVFQAASGMDMGIVRSY